MRAFTTHRGRVLPLDRANVDTDAILPKQFMKSTLRTGYGPFLFDTERYLDEGRLGMDCSRRPLNSGFVLNQPQYRGATILLARRNFGCGSSREHAPWALAEYGFRALLAPSFGDIFQENCLKNGLLPVALDEAIVNRLFQETAHAPGYELVIDLEHQTVIAPTGEWRFPIERHPKALLLSGMDEIDLTLSLVGELEAFGQRHHARHPWLQTAPLSDPGA